MTRKEIAVFIWWTIAVCYVDSCTFPAILEGKTWDDSAKGRPVTFAGSVMTGWNVTFGVKIITSWTCLFNQNNIIVSKATYDEMIPPFISKTYHVYVCMWAVSIEADKFIYYLLADNIVDANTRVYRSESSDLGACDVCKMTLNLDPSQALSMATSGDPSSVTIPAQSGPCSGCSCIATTATTTTSSAITSEDTTSSTTATTTTSAVTSEDTTTSTTATTTNSCTFPAMLEGKTWDDSAKGRPVTFSGSVMTGWNVTFGVKIITSWTCLFNQNNIIVSKATYDEVIPPFISKTYHVYVCMWAVSIEADKFIYYLLADNIVDANTRVYRSESSDLGACDVCNMTLNLDPSQALSMATSGDPSSVTIPAQSGPCSGCSCNASTATTTTSSAITSEDTTTSTTTTTTTSAVTSEDTTTSTTATTTTSAATSEDTTSSTTTAPSTSTITSEDTTSSTIATTTDSCTFPAILEGKTWDDSAKGRPVTFAGSVMTGWNVTFGVKIITSWTCLFHQNNIIVSKATYDEVIPPFASKTYHVYVCMWAVSIEADKFIYYLLADNIVDANTRVYRSESSDLGACDVCKMTLNLDPSQALSMATSGDPSSVTIPAQSGPCSGCSCIATTATTTTSSAITSEDTTSSTTTTTTTSAVTSEDTTTSTTTTTTTSAVTLEDTTSSTKATTTTSVVTSDDTTSSTTATPSTSTITSEDTISSATATTSTSAITSDLPNLPGNILDKESSDNIIIVYTATVIPTVLGIIILIVAILIAKSKKARTTQSNTE
ncbi:mucin-5AC-like isoform X2 [Ostrea edulis]|uniref:mucin-5AC-like isoform X2 n=1 Tax=Ostrea edulis TaxID=37623 RepID=UPI0024AF31BF|nr:mucin-5AC-like isoform X2 [Ostrea edulis]